MTKEDYCKLIMQIVNASKSLEWLIDIYTFIDNYPDNANDEKKE